MNAAYSGKTYLPAAGHDWLLPLYDPFAKLVGGEAARTTLLDQATIPAKFSDPYFLRFAEVGDFLMSRAKKFLGTCHHTALTFRAAVARRWGRRDWERLEREKLEGQMRLKRMNIRLGYRCCCYFPDSVLDESNFVGWSRRKRCG